MSLKTLLLVGGLLTSIGVVHSLQEKHIVDVQLVGEVDYDSDGDAVNALNEADSDTIVRINIDSPGGLVDAGRIVLNAIISTKAYGVVANITTVGGGQVIPGVGVAASMAAQIASAADYITSDKHSIIMFHGASDQVGKFSLVDTDPYRKAVAQQFAMEDSIYSTPFQTGVEYAMQLEGNNLFYNAESIGTRGHSLTFGVQKFLSFWAWDALYNVDHVYPVTGKTEGYFFIDSAQTAGTFTDMNVGG